MASPVCFHPVSRGWSLTPSSLATSAIEREVSITVLAASPSNSGEKLPRFFTGTRSRPFQRRSYSIPVRKLGAPIPMVLGVRLLAGRLIVFASVAAVTGLLVEALTRRGDPSQRAPRPRPTASPGSRPGPSSWAGHPPGDGRRLATHLHDLDAVAAFRRAGDVLALADGNLTAQDARLLREFSTELRLAQEQMQLSQISPHPGTDLPKTDEALPPGAVRERPQGVRHRRSRFTVVV